MFCYLSVSGLCVTLCCLLSSFSFFPFLSSTSVIFFLRFAASVPSLLLSPQLLSCFVLLFLCLTPSSSSFVSTCCPSELSPHSLAFSRTLYFPPIVFSLSLAIRLASCVSEPMVVCAVHPPASHSAPSFLRQYAGHLGRTALRRELGGGLERDRAYLSLHRTGSLGTHTHTHLHSDVCTHL